MRQIPASLAVSLIAAFSAAVLGAGLIGWAAGDDKRSAFGWALLGLVIIIALVSTSALGSLLASVIGAAAFAGVLAWQLKLDGREVTWDAIGPKPVITTAIVLVVAALLVHRLTRALGQALRATAQRRRSVDGTGAPQVEQELTTPTALESVLADEISRSRRYHRPLTLAAIAADDWGAVVQDLGELGARNLASVVVHQLTQGTRRVDKIMQNDEAGFVIVFPETTIEDARLLVARLQSAISAKAGITARAGLADFPRDAVTTEGLLSEAGEALAFARTADLLLVDRTLLDPEA